MRCLVIGHITHDIILKGSERIERVGGGAYYSSLALSKFCEVVVLTKLGENFPISWLNELEEHGISVIIIPSKNSTTYELKYINENRRTLRLLSKAEPFSLEEIPEGKFDMILLNPVANEIPPEIVHKFKEKWLAVDIQGFIREVKNESIILKDIDGSFLSKVKILHADVNEFKHLNNIDPKKVDVLLISNGPESGTAYHEGQRYLYKPIKKDVKESTGAGDVFLAAFSYFYKTLPFIPALKSANAFTAMFLEKRNFDFSLNEVSEKAKFVEVEKVDSEK
ncbi:carbohydrate kinase [Thermococcus sp. MV5]|uniref:PfkB family carbohydrate kinase n=1 Tax=Thermococcus sp. MV5 TaxID=1638272 RepID=UPI00143C4129|nr:PfkB family carbohydrate kinase [Thermococcus sp. MV5]NJE26989.1 carbohydrate kinase [Thermococcus sp. MV5]